MTGAGVITTLPESGSGRVAPAPEWRSGVSTPIWTEDLHGIMPPQPRQSDQPFYCRIKILAGWTLSDRITLLKKHRAEYCHLELGGKVNTLVSKIYQQRQNSRSVPLKRFPGNPNSISSLSIHRWFKSWVRERSRARDCWSLIVSSFQKSLRPHRLIVMMTQSWHRQEAPALASWKSIRGLFSRTRRR